MKIFLSFYFVLIGLACQAQDTIKKERLRTLLVSSSAVYVGAIAGLHYAWYSEKSQSPFHWFDDNSQWMQVDKIGHSYTSYHISRLSTKSFQWAGVSDDRSHIYGALFGVLYQTPIEIMDGFSSGYGASWGDLLANATGSLLWIGQYALWKEERIHFKYSFHRTDYAVDRPNTLGNGLATEWLKDYNGQTYWLSFDLYALTNRSKWIPHWLNVAIGYGADAMLFASIESNLTIGLNPVRQYYLALDLDFSHIKTKSKFTNSILFVLDMIKVPLPTLRLADDGSVKFYPLYF